MFGHQPGLRKAEAGVPNQDKHPAAFKEGAFTSQSICHIITLDSMSRRTIYVKLLLQSKQVRHTEATLQDSTVDSGITSG